MVLPRWIPFAVAAWVIAFGIMRIRMALRKAEAEDEGSAQKRPNYRRGGYYAYSKRTQLGFGIAYLILGGYCVAMGFGYQIDFLGGCLAGRKTTETAPVPQESLPVTVEE